jgi:UPF0755 protein
MGFDTTYRPLIYHGRFAAPCPGCLPAVKIFLRLILILLLALLASAAAVYAWLHRPLSLASDSVEVSIEPRTAPMDAAQAWVQAGVQTDAMWLYQWFRWSGQSRKIRAGSYQIGPGTTPMALLDKMVRGDEVMASVRLLEGWTLRQFRAELARSPHLKPTTSSLSESELMTRLGAAGQSGEGRFYPDTYAFSKGASDLVVLRRAYTHMQRQLQSAWTERKPDTPLQDADQLLILASIVEKETGSAAERGKVAGVFTNRLRLGMLLQTDPSVVYGLGERYDGKIYKRDLLTDTPYNTYTRKGLPPTPIAMPSRAALVAAAQPDPTRALYFVARGNGTSQFSDNLADHNRAVQQFQR